MYNKEKIGTTVGLRPKAHICPICGRSMKEVDRTREGSYIFIWFECAEQSCSGQWLQKQNTWQTKQVGRMVG